MSLSPEMQRLRLLTRFEDEARAEGFCFIAGIDEAGRGPLAGPVVAAACIIPEGVFFEGINDSKQLNEEQRRVLYHQLTTHPNVVYAIGRVEVSEIDRINILQATIQAMLKAVEGLKTSPDLLFVDGLLLPHPFLPVKKMIKGDTLSQSIAAASILAKHSRDQWMIEYDQQWPQYGFAKHKGYGTPQHLEALERYGRCPLHRQSFAPVRNQQLLLFDEKI